MNWGINKDVIVICYGDRFEMIKMYFFCYNPYEIAELLFNYANQKIFDYAEFQSKNPDVKKFLLNNKNRRVNTFNFK